VAVREAASEWLRRCGPGIVPRVIDLCRTSDSPEVCARARPVLLRHPFRPYVELRDHKLLRAALKGTLLERVSEHEGHPGCLVEKDKRVTLDPSSLRITWQDGSGHGQTLRLVRIRSSKEGGLELRRVSYRCPTPYRPKVRAEGAEMWAARMTAEETKALVSLLDEAVALHPKCSIRHERGVWTSADFTTRIRIRSGGGVVWSGGYTGYISSSGEPEYAHPRAVEDILQAAADALSWKREEVSADDRAAVLAWMVEFFPSEAWWVKERYLRIALFVGDETFLPFLRKAEEEAGKGEDASDGRRVKYAREAIEKIGAGDP
jgi:hypothetical protein